jgi:hypothetical protein
MRVFAVVGLMILSCGSAPDVCHWTGFSAANGTCKATFQCGASSMREVDCSPGKGSGDMCSCINAGVVEKTFTSTDFCTAQMYSASAQVGCGWPMM